MIQNGRINSPKIIVSPPNILTSRVMSTIITHAIYIQLDICAQIFPHHMILAKRENKKEQKENFDCLHKSKYIKVKDRPFAEGSRGCHALICLYAQPLSAKEHHVTLPLVIATFIMQSVAFILHHHKFVQRSIFSYTK